MWFKTVLSVVWTETHSTGLLRSDYIGWSLWSSFVSFGAYRTVSCAAFGQRLEEHVNLFLSGHHEASQMYTLTRCTG